MFRIVVGMGSCGIAAGAGRVKEALERAGAKPGITGCVGACYLEPIVDLYDGATLVSRLVRVSPEDAAEIVAAAEKGDAAAVARLAITDEDSSFLSRQIGRAHV